MHRSFKRTMNKIHSTRQVLRQCEPLLTRLTSVLTFCHSAWIGSLQYCLTFLPGLVTGRLFDMGIFKWPFALASALLVVATFIIAECTKYWHFLLVQGLLVGLASGILFGPTMGTIGHWFKKRRSTALGIVAIGSSIGGTVLPILFRNLVGRIGYVR